MTSKKKLLLTTAGVISGVTVASMAGGTLLYDIFIRRNPLITLSPRNNAHDAQHAVDEEAAQKRQSDSELWLGKHAEDTYIKSSDGLSLHAMYVPAIEEKHRYAILCHGYRGQCRETSIAARQFYMWGFHILQPDLRGHGQSEGNYVGMGWPERKDICQWIYRIVNNDPNAQILLMGWSMGAATVMATTEQPLPPNVKAMIEDCGFSSAYEECRTQLKAILHLPAFPLLYLGSLVTRIRAGYSLLDGDLKKLMAACPLPKLFIHGTDDNFVPYHMVHDLYDAACEPKELLTIEGAAHMQASIKEPERYWKTVKKFWQQAID